MIDGLSESGASNGAGAAGVKRDDEADDGRREGQERHQPGIGARHRRDVLGRRGTAALAAAPGPRQLRHRLGGHAEQQERFAGVWAGMAITEPGTGSDSASIATTAVLDGDEYVLNGEKIFVTSGERCDAVVVWATLDKSLGRAAIKSLRGAQGHARHDRRAARAQARHPGLRHRHHPVRGLPGAGRQPAGLTGGRRASRRLRRCDGDLRQHPPAGGRDGGRLCPGVARPDPRPARAGRRDIDYDRPAPCSRPLRPSSSRWRPTGRAPGC